ncbi:MAG: FapA family protein, partial [Candidatus Wallbacteria bacterium]|nr:FapA family protein [Candidatus Wallbacteria bacterium]
IMHSRVFSGGKVQVMGDRGLIVGGLVQARQGITAKEIGSIAFTKTDLTVGFDPETLQKIATIEEQIIGEEEKLAKFELALNSLYKLKKSGQINNQEEYDRKSSQLELFRTRQLEVIRRKKEEITEAKSSGTPLLSAKIRVKDKIFPGVRLEIARESLSIQEEYKFISFYFDPESHSIKWTSF